jgi:hypothetical protein
MLVGSDKILSFWLVGFYTCPVTFPTRIGAFLFNLNIVGMKKYFKAFIEDYWWSLRFSFFWWTIMWVIGKEFKIGVFIIYYTLLVIVHLITSFLKTYKISINGK